MFATLWQEAPIQRNQGRPNGPLSDLISQLAAATVGGHSLRAADIRHDLNRELERRVGSGARPTWTRVSPQDLPHQAGIYVIKSSSGDEHYVGLALDLNDRFHNATYGHLTLRGTSRASRLVASGNFQVELAHVLDATATPDGRVELARLEIETYVTLRLAGCPVTNSFAMLGRAADTAGSPVVLCDCRTGRYVLANSIAAAARYLGSRSLFPVLNSYSRTAHGHAARWAGTREAVLLRDRVDARGFRCDVDVDAAVASEPRDVEWEGEGRSAAFRWRGGPLSESDRRRLVRYQRAKYARRASLQFRAVSWSTRNQAWQCRARRGSTDGDLWQVTNIEWSDLEAAVAREETIRANGWEAFNVGRYASNAVEINRRLGVRRFEPW